MNQREMLKRIGLTNELLDYSDVVDNPVVLKVIHTHCSSPRCIGNLTRKLGVHVESGPKGLNKCPKCGSSDFLAFKLEFKRLNPASRS